MSKICSSCGMEVDNDARFCPNCGSSSFTEAQPVAVATYGAENGGYAAPEPQDMGYAAPAQTLPYVATQPPKKKGMPVWLIVLIVAIPVIIVIAAILLAIALPTFSAATEKGREKTDLANARALKSLAVAQYMAGEGPLTEAPNFGSGDVTCYLTPDGRDISLSDDSVIRITGKWDGEDYGKGDPVSVIIDTKNGAIVDTVPDLSSDTPYSFEEDTSEDEEISFGGFADDDDDDDSDSAYTKGYIEGDYYVNEWANFKFALSDKFPDTPSLYSTVENETTECGFAAQNQEEGTYLIISYEDVSSALGFMTEEKYLDLVKKGLGDALSAYEYSIGAYQEKEIAGETFLVMDINVENGAFHEYVCTRIIGKYAMGIILMTVDPADTELAFDSMQPIH